MRYSIAMSLPAQLGSSPVSLLGIVSRKKFLSRFLPDCVAGLEPDPVGNLSVLFNLLAESFLHFECFN